METRKYTTCFVRCLILLTTQLVVSSAWHGFDNVPYHCWDIATASNTNTNPITCKGVSLRWISIPGETIKAQQDFNMTFEFTVTDSFYTWAATENSYFTKSNVTGFTDSAAAKNWCESTSCPAPSAATEENCCVWHVNVHSCPLEDTVSGLCGPWIPPTGNVFTHSDVIVGPIDTGNWTSYVSGLYQLGVTSIIAHFKVAGVHVALETKVNVFPRAECGDGTCETEEGETCSNCPADCGICPLEIYQIALIALFAAILFGAGIAVVIYFQYQKRKMLWDESWILPIEQINEDDGLRGAFGSMIGSTMDLSSNVSNTNSNSMAISAARRQVFTKTAMYKVRTCAMRTVKKKVFELTKDVRWEVKEVRECDHSNLCKFVGACIEAPHFCILTEYCPKGSMSDVLLNDDVPLNWAFRFSFASDIARGMAYLHTHKIYHGRLKSNNCVVDDRWTVKITDFGLKTLRTIDQMVMVDEDEEEDETYYQTLRAKVYLAPEISYQNAETGIQPSPTADIYAFSIILIEIANRNDPYGDEDPECVPPHWKPELPDLSPEMAEHSDDACPCPEGYTQLICECWHDDPERRPGFEWIKRTIHRINPNKLSPVDLMMAMMEKYSKHLESIVAERTQDLVAEKSKTDRLLYSMLPKTVADELRIGKPINAEIHDACTIYFSDIVGFTTISGRSSPIQVVALLNHLYITFDEIIDKYDVYKVETIGDAYMVVSGIPEATPFHAREVSNMALDLVEACKTFVIPHLPDEPLKIRVGLHSGGACAGVVGLKMPRYCLFGDTVNTASRMESNGEAYKIHISNFTYMELVKTGGYIIEKRGSIPVKGKGDMLTWWLTSRDPNFTTSPLKEKVKDSINEDQMDQTVVEEINLKNTKPTEADKIPLDIQPDNLYINQTVPAPDNGQMFTPVETPATEVVKMRKVSNISTSADSGYNDRPDEESIPENDVTQILVGSCTSFAALEEEDTSATS